MLRAYPIDCRPINIVLAENCNDSRAVLALLLRLHGYSVETATNGEEALAAIQEHRPRAAILDISMTKRDGYAVAKAVRTMPELQGLKLVAYTGWARQADTERAFASGFDYHLAKPAGIAEIINILRSIGVRANPDMN